MKNIFWFTHDLRVQDNPTLKLARERSDNQLTAVFLQDPISAQQMGDPRKRFLCQALAALQDQLASIGIHLRVAHIAWLEQANYLNSLAKELGSEHIFVSKQAGLYERQTVAKLAPHVVEVDANTLFSEQQLPFAIDDLPTTFSRARKLIEKDTALIESLSLDALVAKTPRYAAKSLILFVKMRNAWQPGRTVKPNSRSSTHACISW